MGVLTSQCEKVLLLTGTLMGGYADDLFHLLWRINPKVLIEDGFKPSKSGSMAAATMGFMRVHGVLKDIYKDSANSSHRTAKGKNVTVRTSKALGFGPVGILRYVLPITIFLNLLEFPTIIFMQSGFNVYTMLQAARRSWRIGQKHDVRVIILGYAGTSQMECLRLMAKKIAVSQSTSRKRPRRSQ